MPTIYCSDTFTRADNPTSLGTADVGGTWAPVAAGVWGILGNSAYLSTSGAGNSGQNLDATVSDVSVSVTITWPSLSETQIAGLVARYTDETSYYAVFAFDDATGTIQLYKRTPAFGFMQFLGNSTGFVSGDTLTLQVVGTTIEVYHNGLQAISLTDADITTGTEVGLRTFEFAPTTDWTMNNFVAESPPPLLVTPGHSQDVGSSIVMPSPPGAVTWENHFGPTTSTGGVITASFGSPPLTGDIFVFWVWTDGPQNPIVDSVTAGGQHKNFVVVGDYQNQCGAKFIRGRLCVVPLISGDNTINVSLSGPPQHWMLDGDLIRFEARVPELYTLYTAVSGPADPIRVPALTMVTRGLMLSWAWNDNNITAPPTGWTQTGSGFIFGSGVTWTASYSVHVASGSRSAVDWGSPPITSGGFGLTLPLYDVALAVEAGRPVANASAGLLVPSAPETGIYTSRAPEDLHSLPPDPVEIVVPTPPWTKRSGEPYRRG